MKTKSTTKPRVALYARTSPTGHGQNPELQLEELRQVAGQRGWSVVQEYVDEGVSGRKDSRPALDEMLEAVGAGRVDIVAVWKLDRLGRSLQHLLRILDHLKHCGVQFVSVRDAGMDSTSPSGKLLIHLLAAFCEFEAEVIRERSMAGQHRARAQGKHCGRPVVKLDLRPALALIEQGRGLKQVATILEVNRNTLRRRLREAGKWPLPNRGQKHPSEIHP